MRTIRPRRAYASTLAWSSLRSALDQSNLYLLLHSVVLPSHLARNRRTPSWRTPRIMAILGGAVGYRLLRWISPEGKTTNRDDRAYPQCSKLEALFGYSIWDDLAGKVVIYFGFGTGAEAVEMALHGAAT